MKRKIALFIALPLLACACAGSDIGKRLSDVESYIQTRPDSAAAVLASIDTLELKKPRDRALYSLLHIMAMDKTNHDPARDPKDVRLIEPALSYYSRHGSEEHRLMSFFYRGRISRYAGDYGDAAVYGMKAKRLADEGSSLYWKAMTASEMGYSNGWNYLRAEELKYMSEAYSAWLEYGDSAHVTTAMLDLATALHNNRRYSEADSIFQRLCSLDPPFYYAYAWLVKNESDRPETDYRKVVDSFKTAYDAGVDLTPEHYYYYAYALDRIGERDKCHALLKQLECCPMDYNANFSLYQIAFFEEDYKEAAIRYRKFSSQADTIVRIQLSQSVFKAQTEYLKQESELAEAKSRLKMMVTILVILLVLIFAAVVVGIFRKRQMEISMEKDKLVRLYDESRRMLAAVNRQKKTESIKAKADYSSLEDRYADFQRVFADIFQSHFVAIGQALEHESTRGSRVEEIKSQSLDRVDSIVNSIKRDTRNQQEFERIINAQLDDIMAKLRSDFPEFSEDDYQFLSYTIAGFDYTTCSILLDGTPNKFRVMKSRLLGRIRSRDTVNRSLYLAFLEPRTKAGRRSRKE